MTKRPTLHKEGRALFVFHHNLRGLQPCSHILTDVVRCNAHLSDRASRTTGVLKPVSSGLSIMHKPEIINLKGHDSLRT